MAKPTHQQLMSNIFTSKKTWRKSSTNQKLYQTRLATAKMMELLEDDRNTHKESGNPEHASLQKLQEINHLDSNWPNTSNTSDRENLAILTSSPTSPTESSASSTASSEYNITPPKIVTPAAENNCSRTSDNSFLSYHPRLSRNQKQRQFFSYLGLRRKNDDDQQKPLDQSCQTVNEIYLEMISKKNIKELNDIPCEKFLAIDFSSPMGKKLRKFGIFDETSTIDISSLTRECPKKISSRSKPNSDGFLVTYKKPKKVKEEKKANLSDIDI